MLIPQGHYRGVINNPEIAISSKKDTPCFTATATILEDCPNKGERHPWEGWLTQDAARRSIEALQTAGCRFQIDPQTGEPDLEDFEGCGSVEVDLVIVHEEFTPEATDQNPRPTTGTRARIAFINALGRGRSTKKIDDEQKKMIARRFGATAKQVLAAGAASGGAASGGSAPNSFDTKAMDAADAAEKAAAAAKNAPSKGDKGGAKAKSY